MALNNAFIGYRKQGVLEEHLTAIVARYQEVLSLAGEDLSRNTRGVTWEYRLDALHSRFVELIKDSRMKLGQSLDEPLVVIDVGIGKSGAPTTFGLLATLREAGFTNVKVIGVDNNASYVDLANRKAKELGVTNNIEFFRVDNFNLEVLNLPQVDAVICSNVLMDGYYNESAQAVARQRMANALGENGLLIISDGPTEQGYPVINYAVYVKDGSVIEQSSLRGKSRDEPAADKAVAGTPAEGSLPVLNIEGVNDIARLAGLRRLSQEETLAIIPHISIEGYPFSLLEGFPQDALELRKVVFEGGLAAVFEITPLWQQALVRDYNERITPLVRKEQALMSERVSEIVHQPDNQQLREKFSADFGIPLELISSADPNQLVEFHRLVEQYWQEHQALVIFAGRSGGHDAIIGPTRVPYGNVPVLKHEIRHREQMKLIGDLRVPGDIPAPVRAWMELDVVSNVDLALSNTWKERIGAYMYAEVHTQALQQWLKDSQGELKKQLSLQIGEEKAEECISRVKAILESWPGMVQAEASNLDLKPFIDAAWQAVEWYRMSAQNPF